MTASIANPLTRRAALTGLGAGGLGLALAARGVAAQDAPVEMDTHPIVGAWTLDFDQEHPGTLLVHTIFHADGTRVLLHPFAGSGIGVWRATGERTGETTYSYQNIAVTPGDFVQGNVTVWGTFSVDESGNAHSEEGVVELRSADGKVVALFPYAGTSAKMVVEPPPPLGTPAEASPTT